MVKAGLVNSGCQLLPELPRVVRMPSCEVHSEVCSHTLHVCRHEIHGLAGLGPDVAISCSIHGLAAPIWRDHACPLQHGSGLRHQAQQHSCYYGTLGDVLPAKVMQLVLAKQQAVAGRPIRQPGALMPWYSCTLMLCIVK